MLGGLSVTAAHALRALACLAAAPTSEPLLARDLARCAQVPMGYLSKILHTLVRAGILSGQRGLKGGYQFARPPREVTVLEVVELFDGPQNRESCLLAPFHRCSDEEACAAHREYKRLKEEMLLLLSSLTLDRLSAPQPWSREKKA